MKIFFKSKTPCVVPLKTLQPYQGIILKAADVLTYKNPTGLGAVFGAITMISILFFIMDPPVLTSIAILLFGFVWADHLLPLLKADREQSLVKDERLKDLYYKYVYVATYFSNLWQTIQGYRKENEYVYVAFASLFLITIALVGKAVNNGLLLWAVMISMVATIAALVDGEIRRD